MMLRHDHDVRAVLARRHHSGGDFWATPDQRIYVPSPCTTFLAELAFCARWQLSDEVTRRYGEVLANVDG